WALCSNPRNTNQYSCGLNITAALTLSQNARLKPLLTIYFC
ncbi:MAG: hypothetical protein, partial [Olavius algarvensis Delta 4 endosymbiont]